MTIFDYLLYGALIAPVVSQVNGRRVNLRWLVLPVAVVAYVAFRYLHGIPTSGANLDLAMAGAGAGLLLGTGCGLATAVFRRADGAAIAKAGAAAVVLWVVGVGARLAFALYASHGAGPPSDTSPPPTASPSGKAWAACLILMALGEVAARSAVLGAKYARLGWARTRGGARHCARPSWTSVVAGLDPRGTTPPTLRWARLAGLAVPIWGISTEVRPGTTGRTSPCGRWSRRSSRHGSPGARLPVSHGPGGRPSPGWRWPGCPLRARPGRPGLRRRSFDGSGHLFELPVALAFAGAGPATIAVTALAGGDSGSLALSAGSRPPWRGGQAATIDLLAERNHLAREVHDVLAHTLGALSVQLEALDVQVEASPAVPGSVRRGSG